MSFVQDLRLACRSLLRRPAFSAVAILTLALGLGATSAIFSVVRAVLFSAIPFPEPERLVKVMSSNRANAGEEWPVCYLDYVDWKEQAGSFEELEIYSPPVSFNLMLGERPEHVEAEMISHGLFDLLDVKALRGRLLTSAEDQPGGPRVAILEHDYWRVRFGGDESVIGQSLRLNGELYEVIGVVEPGFRGLSDQVEIFLPIQLATTALAPHYIEVRHYRWLQTLGRLRSGVSLEEARAEMDGITARLEEAYPMANQNAASQLTLLVDTWVGDLRLALWLLLGASGLVLLIAWTNVAHLLLVRAMTRQREIAVRRALGANRALLSKQLLIESGVLTLCGCALGLILAHVATGWLVQASGIELRNFMEVGVHPPVILAMVGLSLIGGLLFGLAPVAFASRLEPVRGLRETGATSGVSRQRSLRFLVVAQIALALVLIFAAGTLIERFRSLAGTDLGFRTERLLTLRIDMKGEAYANQDLKRQLVRNLGERIPAVPGVASFDLVGPGVATDDWYGGHYTVDERLDTTVDSMVLLAYHCITPDYFANLGIPLLAGRVMGEEDHEDAPLTIVVSQAMADRFWPGQDPLGKRMKSGPRDSPLDWHTVVGVVADVHQHGLREPNPVPDIYYSIYQYVPISPPILNLLVRAEPGYNASALRDEVAQAVLEVDPQLPVFDVATLDERLDDQISRQRFIAWLMSLFAGLALLLATLGIYGLLQFIVVSGQKEIGIRLAMGADRGKVQRLIAGRGLRLAAVGALVGLLGILALTQVLRRLVIDLNVSDWPLLVLACAVLLLASFLACLLPARRATRVDPVDTLRQE